jgi:hypothetical protein
MRFILGFLSGVLGMLAGWFALAFLVVTLGGPDRDGGLAMGAFFNIGPIGGLAGFVAGVWLFIKFGLVSRGPSSPAAERAAPAPAPPGEAEPFEAAPAPAAPLARTRVSPIFAAAVLALVGGLAWWGWYELIRSPYLTHGFMTLELQFKLPAGMALPPEAKDVHIVVEEGGQYAEPMLGPAWHGTDDNRRVILAHATLSMKTSHRVVRLELPGVAEQTWRVDLSSDPDPTPGYSPWRLSSNGPPAPKIEMNFRLTADR